MKISYLAHDLVLVKSLTEYRHTGTTELPLTSNGERRIRATGRALVGPDRLIVPSKLAHM